MGSKPHLKKVASALTTLKEWEPSVAKAQMERVRTPLSEPGRRNCAKLHCDCRYDGVSDFGSMLPRNAKLERGFSVEESEGELPEPADHVPRIEFGRESDGGLRGVVSASSPSSSLKRWIVPRSEPTSSQALSLWKQRHWISAGSAPRRNSKRRCPERLSQTRISVPRSEAVASLEPLSLRAKQEREASCAGMRVLCSVSKSSARTWPFCNPQQARTQKRGSAQRAQRPRGFEMVSMVLRRFRSAKLYT
mmetsp:Transcript_35766/g.76368  ORF Transcript_35766/g.76368 Transcript_35766/m.76368 type:complete len:249 (+) Transcript_35766:441-1187(+)